MLLWWAMCLTVGLLVVLVGVLFGSGWLRRIALVVSSWRPIRQRDWGPTVVASIEELIGSLELLRSPKRAANLTSLSLLVWVLEGGMFACVAMGLDTDVYLIGPWFALATGTLATMLPSMPGYLGTFDFLLLRA